jgi:leucine-rich repeat protein SHOC2
MTSEEVEQAIATAKDNRWRSLSPGESTDLSIGRKEIYILPESIGDLINLTTLALPNNQLINLPDSIGNLTNLTTLAVPNNRLTNLPDSIGNLTHLITLAVYDNQLTSLPNSIGNLTSLTWLELTANKLTSLPDSIGNLTSLVHLKLRNNQLTSLPDSMRNMTSLNSIDLTDNPLMDLSVLASIPNLKTVRFLRCYPPRRYWTKLSEWKAEWLLDENNAAIRHTLIEELGYEKICDELNAITLDIWREYTLLKIDGVEKSHKYRFRTIDREPMVLLKMTCPSTAHIHILRVPPEMVSAEEAITWVNHGIHPDRFTVQT